MWSLSGRGGGGHPSIWDPALLPGPGMAPGAGCGAKGVAAGAGYVRWPEVSAPVPCLCTLNTSSGRQGRKGVPRRQGNQATSLPVESMTEAMGPGASAFPLGNRAGAFHSLLRRQMALRDGAVAQDRGSWVCGSELHLVRPGSS